MTTTILTDEQMLTIISRHINHDNDDMRGKPMPLARAIVQAVLQSEQVQAWRAMSDEYNELIRHIHSGGDALEFLSNRAAMEAQK